MANNTNNNLVGEFTVAPEALVDKAKQINDSLSMISFFMKMIEDCFKTLEEGEIWQGPLAEKYCENARAFFERGASFSENSTSNGYNTYSNNVRTYATTISNLLNDASKGYLSTDEAIERSISGENSNSEASQNTESNNQKASETPTEHTTQPTTEPATQSLMQAEEPTTAAPETTVAATTATAGIAGATEKVEENTTSSTTKKATSNKTVVEDGMTPKLDSWLKELEDTKPTTTINGEKYYKAYKDNGTYAASSGVQVIDNNGNRYLSDNAYVEQNGEIYVKQSAVDNLYHQEVAAKKDRVINAANEQNVSLNEDQVNAMTSYVYRTGTGKKQAENAMAAYAEGGNEALRAEMYSHRNKGDYEEASVKRMAAEYILFTEGTYTDNPYDMSYEEALEIMTG